MKINIIKDNNLENNEIMLDIYYSDNNKRINEFIEYLNYYELNYKNKVIVADNNYTLLEIEYNDIIMFYSDKKNNYCVVKDKKYMVKSRLYELEKISIDFIRISKKCIINIRHVKKFDLSQTGKIIAKLDNNTEEVVSRRKTSEIMKYLETRRI